MRITHLGHACVLVEIEDPGAPTKRILVDPGNFSTGLDELGRVDAVLVTHEHVDHLDPIHIETIRQASPSAAIYGGRATTEVLRGCGVEAVELAESVDFDVAGVRVEVVAGQHESIHLEVPSPTNHAYLIGGAILHPGDSWTEPAQAVDVLLLPIGGPWMKLAEAVEYLRRVRPRLAIPIHQQGLAPEHQQLHIGVLKRLAPKGTDVRVLEIGQPTPT